MNPENARALFDRHAASYARVNRVISAGLDARWRAWAAGRAVRSPGDRVLDAMTGTGEVAVLAAGRGARVTAVDISPEMLWRAHRRAREAGAVMRTAAVDLASDDLPPEWRFEAVTLSFGLRYADDPISLLRQLSRAIVPGGRLVVLEFCVPPDDVVGRMPAAYFFHVLPHLGGLLGTDRDLYETLTETTRSIGGIEHLEGLLERSGLVVTERRRFGFGLVAGFVAVPGAHMDSHGSGS